MTYRSNSCEGEVSHTCLQIVRRQCHLLCYELPENSVIYCPKIALFYKLPGNSVIVICNFCIPVFSEWYNALFFKLPENSVILLYQLSINHVICCSTRCQGMIIFIILPAAMEHCQMLFYFSRE